MLKSIREFNFEEIYDPIWLIKNEQYMNEYQDESGLGKYFEVIKSTHNFDPFPTNKFEDVEGLEELMNCYRTKIDSV